MKPRASRARKQSRSERTLKPRGVFSVRFSEHELATLRVAAANAGASLAALVRQIVVAAVDRPQSSVFILGSQSGASARAQVFGEIEHENLWLTS